MSEASKNESGVVANEEHAGVDDLLAKIQQARNGTLAGQLGIEFTEARTDRIVAIMPVDGRTLQPAGILHGGASLALAETIASVGATLNAGPGRMAVGMEINANHLRTVKSGKVRGVAVPLHVGRMSSVWEFRLYDETDRLTCVGRMTAAFVPIDRGEGIDRPPS